MIGVGVNGFLFFLGLLVYVISVVIGVMVFFFFFSFLFRQSGLIWMMEELCGGVGLIWMMDWRRRLEEGEK